jgi:uncharacterized protein YbaP (TraB family)
MHLILRRRVIRTLAMCALACAALVPLTNHASAKPALWVVKSPNATVYLFGTFHMLPPRTHWKSPTVEKAMAASQEIWTEADIESLPAVVRLIHRYGLDHKGNVKAVLGPTLIRRYESAMATAGLSVELYSHVKPWLAQLLLTGNAMKQARFGYGVETDLIAYAKAHHKKTPTFETPDEQFALLADLPDDAQIPVLQQEVANYDKRANMLNTLVNAWLAGNDDRLDELSNKQLLVRDASGNVVNERYFDDVIVRRNERFAEHIAERLQTPGVAFVAVGAAHLCGSASVQAMLKNYGYHAERVTD